MTAEVPDRQYCSMLSSQAGERLPGTAIRTRVNLLLEYNRAWGEKAFEECQLPELVKKHLSAALDALTDARILLIRGEPGAMLRFFVALGDEGREALYEFHLSRYEDLVEIDILSVVAGDAVYEARRRIEPLFLVCTHGRRDNCCSKFGLPVYQALREQVGEQAWQCSHVGGHRFAANVIYLPAGIVYGRLHPGNIGKVVQSLLNDELTPDFFRGRMSYTAPVQAAEFLLRQQTGAYGLADYHLFSAVELKPDNWRVRFLERKSGYVHQLDFVALSQEYKVYENCYLEKQVRPIAYQLVDYLILDEAPRVV